MGNICSNMEEEYDTELRRGVGNDLVKELHYDFASVNFLESFYPQMIAQDFWSIVRQRSRCKEGDKDARVSYSSLRRYIRKNYQMVTDNDVDTLYRIVMPNIRRFRATITDLKSEKVDILTFVRLSYLFYRFYDILYDPQMWIFYWADMFYTGYASLMTVQALTAFTYQLDKKDMRYLFRMIQNTAGWMGGDQWPILSEGLESLGKVSKNTQVYANWEKRATVLKRNREKSMADKDALEKEVERAIEGQNEGATADLAPEQQGSTALLSRKNLDILNKRALLLAQGVEEADVLRLLKMSTSQTGIHSSSIPAPPATHSHGDVWGSSKCSKVHSTYEQLAKASEDGGAKGMKETEVVGLARLVLTPVREGTSSNG